jgi:hypothetical protein
LAEAEAFATRAYEVTESTYNAFWHHPHSVRVRDPMRWNFKFTSSFQPHYALGFTQPLTEISTRNIKIIIIIMFLGSKVRLVRGADNLTAIYEPIV